MSQIGIDFGENCILAVWKNGKRDIDTGGQIRSAVQFSDKERIVGPAVGPDPDICKDVDAKEELKDLAPTEAERNLISDIKQLIGVKFSELNLTFTPFSVRKGDDGYVLVDVDFLGTRRTFKPPELLAMVFSELKIKAWSLLEANEQKELKCCIGVPAYFTAPQRNAVRAAAKIAGLNPWMLHETTAIALAYLHFSRVKLEKREQILAIIDVGRASMQISFIGYSEDQLRVLSYKSDSSLGGKQLDISIFEHFADQLKDQKNLDVKQNKHACIRLLKNCERLKIQICNKGTSSPILFEMEGESFNLELSKKEFSDICDKALDGIKILQKAFEEACLNSKDKLCAKKMKYVVTGLGREVPAVCEIVAEFFGEKSLTGDKLARFSVAKGCVLQCAIRGNTDKKNEDLKRSDKIFMRKMENMLKLQIVDRYPFSITTCWEQNLQKSDNHTLIFEKDVSWPCTQCVSVTHNASKLSVYAIYGEPVLPAKICTVEIKWPSSNGGNTTSDVWLSIDENGELSIEPDAFAELEYECEMRTKDIAPAKKEESDFVKLQAMKNDVVDYIVKTLEKLNGKKYDQVLKAEDKASFINTFKDAQISLSGPLLNKYEYYGFEFETLKKIADRIEARHTELIKRPAVIKEFKNWLAFVKEIDAADAKIAYSEAQKWFDEKHREQKFLPHYADPVLLTDDINERIERLKKCKQLKWSAAVKITYNIESGDLDTYNKFIFELRRVLADHQEEDPPKMINGRPVLEKQRPDAQPSRWILIHLELGEGLVLVLAVRGDNVYFLGFQNRLEEWYELGLSVQTENQNTGNVRLIPGSTFLETGSDYSGMVCGTKPPAKPDLQVVKEEIGKMDLAPRNMRADALLLYNHPDDNTDLRSVRRACGRIALRLCEPTRLNPNHDDMNDKWSHQRYSLIGKFVDFIWNWKYICSGIYSWKANNEFNWETNRFCKALGITSIDLATNVVALILNKARARELVEGGGKMVGGEENEQDPGGGGGEGSSGGGGGEGSFIGFYHAQRTDFVSKTTIVNYTCGHVRPLVELFSIYADSPIVGTIALYDGCHSQYVYSHKDRTKSRTLDSLVLLTLTGPFEAAIPADSGFLLEVDIPRTTAEREGDAAQWRFEWNPRLYKEINMVSSHRMKTIQGRHLTVSYAVLSHAVEANVHLNLHLPRPKMVVWPVVQLSGSITATITTLAQGIELFSRSQIDGIFCDMTLDHHGLRSHVPLSIPLDRHVLAMPATAEVHILGDLEVFMAERSHTFAVDHKFSMKDGHQNHQDHPDAPYTSLFVEFR